MICVCASVKMVDLLYYAFTQRTDKMHLLCWSIFCLALTNAIISASAWGSPVSLIPAGLPLDLNIKYKIVCTSELE